MSENDERKNTLSDKKAKSSKPKHSKHKKKNIVKDYALMTSSFVAVALALTIVTVCSFMSTAENLVHKLENAAPMDVCDIELSDGTTMYNIDDCEYGNYVANIVCEERGLNAKVYMGYNRASARDGAALYGKSGLFTSDETTIAAGYDETYFASLKYLEEGDTITVSTSTQDITYKVTDMYYDSEDLSLDDTGSDLVLCSLFSSFSDRSGESLYVFAEEVTREGY